MKKLHRINLVYLVIIFMFIVPVEINAEEGNVSINETEILSPIYQIGDSDERILEMKLDLATLGFRISDNPNGDFGLKTESAIKDFQDYYNLEVTGIADRETLDKLDELISTSLMSGKSHPDSISLKEKLTKLGFHVSNNPNEDYGPKTANKVRDFQSFYGLVVSGVADPITLAKIEELLNMPLQIGLYREDVVDMKLKLAELGFIVSENPTPQFGYKTEETVKDFQKYYGLVVTGIADETTLQKIDEIIATSMRKWNSYKALIPVKKKLSQLGFKVSEQPNGDFGTKTESIVRDFQEYYGLKESGVVEVRTLSKLDDLITTSLMNGRSHPDVIQLKEKLSKLGFHVSDNPNEDYGPKTASTVRELQSFYGLIESGVADPVTISKIEVLINTPFELGSYRKEVVDMKLKLSELGFVVSKNPTPEFGPKTKKIVEEFQKYYGLSVTGIADDTTLYQIDDILKTSMKKWNNYDALITVKRKLSQLGFTISNNPTKDFGNKTESTVKDFQKYYGIKVNGIIDKVTLAMIEEVLKSPLRKGQSHSDAISLKKNLSKLGFHVSDNPNKDYGLKTESTVKDFQRYYGIRVNGIADKVTLAKINEIQNSPLRKGQSHPDAIPLKEKLSRLGFHVSNKPNKDYGLKTESAVREFQEYYGLAVNGIADNVTLKKIETEIKKLKKLTKIFLDPGHGGKDPGGQAYGLREKDIVLDIALEAAKVLRSEYKDVDVKLSRTEDRFIELEERARIANDWGASYFLSLHTNAFPSGTASGFESYIYNGVVSKQTIYKQRQIHRYLIDRISIADRGMKEANFNVLRNSKMPSILIEYMFIDNYNENSKLKNKSYRKWLGNMTAKAIANSFGLEKK